MKLTGETITELRMKQAVNDYVVHFDVFYRAIRERQVGEGLIAFNRARMRARQQIADAVNAHNEKEETMPRKEFNVHVLNEEGQKKAADVGEVFSDALTKIEAIIGDDVGVKRELALVITKLQEASFFAKRAVALQPSNQQS